MEVIARLQYLRIAPRKVRLVADLIRGKSIEQAQNILNFTIKKAASPLLKLLNSAVANAKNNFQLESANLFISKIEVNEGPKYKRWQPRARGQVSEIQKKTSHVNLVLSEIKPGAKKVKRIKKKPVAAVVEAEKEKETIQPKPTKPKPELAIPKPKLEKGFRRIFKRKAF